MCSCSHVIQKIYKKYLALKKLYRIPHFGDLNDKLFSHKLLLIFNLYATKVNKFMQHFRL